MVTFQAPGFAWAFLMPLAVAALYLLRRRYAPKQVPSTLLWRRAVRESAANRPFQRLRSSLLMMLRILALSLLALALMRPSLSGGRAGRSILILDQSASMLTRSGGRSRMEEALEEATKVLQGLPQGETITILAAGEESRPVVTTREAEEAIRALKDIRAGRTDSRLDRALSLARAMARDAGETEETTVWVFSDTFSPETYFAHEREAEWLQNSKPARNDRGELSLTKETDGAEERIQAINVGRGEANRAVISLEAEAGMAYASVSNFGPDCVLSLVCEADGETVGAREMDVGEGESAGAVFSLPPDARWVSVSIREEDALAEDNRVSVPVRKAEKRLAALASESIFLESALRVRPDITVVRTDREALASLEADWYIWGEGPVVLTSDAKIAAEAVHDSLSPEEGDETVRLKAGEETVISWPREPREATAPLRAAENTPLTASVSLKDVSLRAFYPLSGGKAALLSGGETAAAWTEDAVVIGFDPHESNWPMKYDFPLFIQNALAFLENRKAARNSEEVGPGGESDENDAANRLDPLPAAESDVRFVAPSHTEAAAAAASSRGRDLTPWLLLGFLILLMAEMGVSRCVR